jgi:hypothetical protein
MRCVPSEELNSALTAKTKALKRGAARLPVLVFPGNANLPIGGFLGANREIGVTGKETWVRPAFGYVCHGGPSVSIPSSSYFYLLFSFWQAKRLWALPAHKYWERRTMGAGREAAPGRKLVRDGGLVSWE